MITCNVADAGARMAIRNRYRATPLTKGAIFTLNIQSWRGSIHQSPETTISFITTVNAPSCHLEPHPIFGPHRNIANIISR